MTPTMSEYFEAWKNSRFIAGGKASEKAFVAASRLSGHRRHPRRARVRLRQRRAAGGQGRPPAGEADEARASTKLHEFAADLRDKEAAGSKYTAEEADTLGSQAQERAEAIAGQITQAAAKLNIEIEEG